ncbi:MAG: SpaA isopeptide-forming pilin-related protein [Eubacteriales bacterium]|nr:SpaA isopeptide-forming pilin-related protein [Eubacteriales bacterium]
MKRRKWQKAVALLAGVMMVCTLPGVENLVETSHFVRAESSPEGAFSDGEMQAQEARVLSQYSEADVWSSGEDGDLFSSGGENNSPVQMVPDTAENAEETTSEPMQVNVTLTGEIQDKKAQGEAQWIQIHAEDASLASEGESRVRIHLYDNADRSPADDLEVLLFTEKQEKIPETAVLPPVVLERALNGAEELTVSRKQIYQQDENGTILLDENGEQIVTDDYLEFTLPAGKTADFYAALLYRNVEEVYSYDALLNTEVLQKVNGAWRSVLNWNEAAETTVGWTNPETAAAENAPEEQAAEPEISDEEGQETEDSASQIFADGEESESGQEGGNAAEETADEEISEDENPAEETGNSEEPDSSEETAGSEEKDSLEEESSLEEPGASEEEGSIEEIGGSKEEDDSEKSGTDEEENPTDDEEDQETEDIETDNTETEDTEADISKADMSEQEENTSRILVTMTKELGEGPEEMMTNEPEASEETKEEGAEVFQESDTDTTERIEETAVSGQTYAVHVQAQDLQPEAKYDSVVTIHLTDLATGLPATDVATAVCLSKEAALASEAAFETELPEAVQTPAGVQNLKVTRMQETADTETGESTVTDDYLQFTLPAGSSADFYLGLTYTTEEADYNKQLILDVKAVQYVPIEETAEPSVSDDADTAADPNPNQNTADDTSQSELLADESSAPTDAAQELLSAPVNIACTELVGLGDTPIEQVEDIEEFLQSDAAEELSETDSEDETQNNVQGVKTVDVLAGAQMLTMTWSAAAQTVSDDVTVYFAQPEEWAKNGYEVKVFIKPQSDSDTYNQLKNMVYTGQTYNGLKVYTVSFTSSECPYGGFSRMLFQAFENEKWVAEYNALEKIYTDSNKNWAKTSSFSGKIYNSATESWEEYIPFNPDDHTFFQDKTIYFENRGSESLTENITAIFYEKQDNNLAEVSKITMTSAGNNRYSVVIPTEACSYVQFCDANGRILGDTYSNFYGQGEGETGVESFIYNESSMCSYHYVSTADDSTWGTIGGRTVYYDATLSKLSYVGTEDAKGSKYGIPYPDDVVYYYATGTGKEPISGAMAKAEKDSWKDVYAVDLPEGYTRIRFTGWKDPSNETAAQNGDGTAMLDIPTNLVAPCFYGDSSDDAIYTGGNRGGYWDEVYSVRDAEAGKGKPVVDVPNGSFTRESNILYLNTTLYDYYTDYELNGNNRDDYNAAATVGSHRIYQPFRQLNQALSDYYSSVNAEYPLYWGNFQNYKGSHFTEISDTLGLYGFDKNGSSDLYKKFFYENNSMWGRNGAEITQAGQNATQGLAAKSLLNGNIALSSSDGSVFAAPFFNESFLNGSNSKNTVLGKVYHDVSFPFIKKSMTSGSSPSATGTVEYWYFNSADNESTTKNRNLQLQYDSQQEYFLKSMPEGVKGQTANTGYPATENGNYFPFNTTGQSGKAAQLNYGFGQKIEFTFRLTKDGTVMTTNNEKVPIEFNFSGDDDVWVYIDDELVLDVGGGHGVVSGRINFQDLTAWVSKVKNNNTSGGYKDNVTTAFPESLKNGIYEKDHTLTMFYMERGLWESNMEITFNFPDENKLQIEKVVDKTEVNDLFKKAFDNLSIFTFGIRNLATHYGTKDAVTNPVEPVSISLTSGVSYTPTPGNTFKLEPNLIGEKTNTVHWSAGLDDSTGTNRDKRYGTMTLNSAIDISDMQYLEFRFYYRYNDTPGLQHMYLQLVDTAGNIMGNKTDYLSGKVYGTSSMSHDQWVTVKIDLSKLQSDRGFNSQVAAIKFGYNWGRDIYLSDFTFYPSTLLMSGSTGFVTKQYEIPDYGTAVDSVLKAPVGAQYSSSNGNNYEIGTSGEFVLKNGETVTFHDQFRRGSYIALEEKAVTEEFKRLFSTSWTMYENESAVMYILEDSNTVTSRKATALVNVPDYAVDDGRTEKYITGSNDGQTIENAYKGEKPEDSTFVFRSYFEPDNTTNMVNLKVVYTNKVNTGSLVIRKEQETGSENLTGEYEFEVSFSDIGGMALENAPITTAVTLKAGEEIVINGIPLGTYFSVKEKQPSDGSVLSKITVNGVEQSLSEKTATGTISYEEGNSAEVIVKTVFTNVKKPVVNVNVKKVWKNADGTEMTDTPDSINVRLQRRIIINGEDQQYETVSGYEKITISPGYLEGKWKDYIYSIEGLDEYDNFQNQETRNKYEYRFVELDANDQPVENGGFIEPYKVTIETTETVADDIQIGSFATTITNTYSPKTILKITKVNVKNELLGGVEFKLEKLDSSREVIGVPVTETTGVTNEPTFGLAVFENLTDGTYRLTETKTAEGYSLLKDPITVVIDRTNGCTVDGENVVVTDNTISITITNQKKFDIPATGSWSRYIISLAGAILAGLAIIMYLLQKRRREGKTS